MARQKLGQHFLQDPGWRRKIAQTLPLASGDTWIEVGAGHGELTQSLAGDSRRVVAVETDASLANRLSERVREDPAGWPGVTVVHGDVLSLDLAELVRPAEKFRVYGNLPYYITSPILERVFHLRDAWESGG